MRVKQLALLIIALMITVCAPAFARRGDRPGKSPILESLMKDRHDPPAVTSAVVPGREDASPILTLASEPKPLFGFRGSSRPVWKLTYRLAEDCPPIPRYHSWEQVGGAPVPEPASLAALGTGLFGLLLRRRMRR